MKSILLVFIFISNFFVPDSLFTEQYIIMGFTEKAASEHLAKERDFDRLLNQDILDEWRAQSFENTVEAKFMDSKMVKVLNQLLIKMEPSMTLSRGLLRRPWFRHHISASRFYTGFYCYD